MTIRCGSAREGVACRPIKRDALMLIGGYDVGLPAFEDWDLHVRLALAGAAFVAVALELASAPVSALVICPTAIVNPNRIAASTPPRIMLIRIHSPFRFRHSPSSTNDTTAIK